MSEDEEVDGARIAADILNRMHPAHKEKLVRNIQTEAPEVAEKIEDNLYNFDEIADLNPQSIQTLIGAIDKNDLLHSLKLASDAVKEALFNNLSERRRQIVKDEYADLPQIKLADAQAAQRRVLEVLEKLRSEGKIRSHNPNDVWV